MDKLKISVVILNYNGIENTLECINSLMVVNKKNIDLDLIVVDNNSQDDSQKKLKKLNNIKLVLLDSILIVSIEQLNESLQRSK